MFEVDCSLQLRLGLVRVVAEEVTLGVAALQEDQPPLPPPGLEEDVWSLVRRRLGEPALV